MAIRSAISGIGSKFLKLSLVIFPPNGIVLASLLQSPYSWDLAVLIIAVAGFSIAMPDMRRILRPVLLSAVVSLAASLI